MWPSRCRDDGRAGERHDDEQEHRDLLGPGERLVDEVAGEDVAERDQRQRRHAGDAEPSSNRTGVFIGRSPRRRGAGGAAPVSRRDGNDRYDPGLVAFTRKLPKSEKQPARRFALVGASSAKRPLVSTPARAASPVAQRPQSRAPTAPRNPTPPGRSSRCDRTPRRRRPGRADCRARRRCRASR